MHFGRKKTHIQSNDKTLFLCDSRLKTFTTADLQALNFIVFYYTRRYLLFILVYFDCYWRRNCRPLLLPFFSFYASLLLLFLTLFPWYISFWQQELIYIHINLYKCKYEYRHDLSVQFEWRMKKRHAYTLLALALKLRMKRKSLRCAYKLAFFPSFCIDPELKFIQVRKAQSEHVYV